MRKCTHLTLRFTGPPNGNQTINAAKQTADMDTWNNQQECVLHPTPSPETTFCTMKYAATSPKQRTFLFVIWKAWLVHDDGSNENDIINIISITINQSWGHTHVVLPTPRRHPWRLRLASLHAGSIPIPSDSQKEASTILWASPWPPSSRVISYKNCPLSRIGFRVSRHMPI